MSERGPAQRERLARLALLLLLLAHGALLWSWNAPVAGGSDSSGYLNHARLLLAGDPVESQRIPPALAGFEWPSYTFVPLGYRPGPTPDTRVPTYAVGLPLLLTLGVPAGETGIRAVLVLIALSGVAASFWLAREVGLATGPSALAAAVVAASPVFLFMAQTPMSDVAALTFVTLAVTAALASERSAAFGLLAGAALGMAVLVRPANALAALPVALALAPRWRAWLATGAAGLPFALGLMAYQHYLYGHALESGYGDVGNVLSPDYVPRTLLHYARWLPLGFSPLVLVALAAPWLGPLSRRVAVCFAGGTLAFAGFYACFFHTHETWWYLRFLLPILPPLAVTGVAVVEALAARRPPHGRAAAWPALVYAASLGTALLVSVRLHVPAHGWGDDVYPATLERLAALVPPGAPVVCMQMSGAITYYTDRPIVRWDTIEPPVLSEIGTHLAAAGVPLYAVLFEFERDDPRWQAHRAVPGGRWEPIDDGGRASFWRFTADAPPER